MGRHNKVDKKQSSSGSPAEAAFNEAETLQQRGERRKGREALVCFDQAVAKYEEALNLGLPPSKVPEAYFGIAESAQSEAAAVHEACAALPDGEASLEQEHASLAIASSLYSRAVQSYKLVPVEGGGPAGSAGAGPSAPAMREDAAVNSGNALSAWAEIVADNPQLPFCAQLNPEALLLEAKADYEHALRYEDECCHSRAALGSVGIPGTACSMTIPLRTG
eukprot:gene27498-4807_t